MNDKNITKNEEKKKENTALDIVKSFARISLECDEYDEVMKQFEEENKKIKEKRTGVRRLKSEYKNSKKATKEILHKIKKIVETFDTSDEETRFKLLYNTLDNTYLHYFETDTDFDNITIDEFNKDKHNEILQYIKEIIKLEISLDRKLLWWYHFFDFYALLAVYICIQKLTEKEKKRMLEKIENESSIKQDN